MQSDEQVPIRDFDIRRLIRTDLAEIGGMLSVFAEAFGDPHAYNDARPDPDYLARLLASNTFIAIVAVRDNAVIGGLAAYVLEKFEQVRREVYIYDLAVAEEFRRRGVATALIRALQSEAARRGAYVIFVQADRDDAPAIALYETLGTREDVLHFDIEVPVMKREN